MKVKQSNDRWRVVGQWIFRKLIHGTGFRQWFHRMSYFVGSFTGWLVSPAVSSHCQVMSVVSPGGWYRQRFPGVVRSCRWFDRVAGIASDFQAL